MNVSDLPIQVASKIKVDNATGCWLWTASTDERGYGRIRINYLEYKAHRVTFHHAHPEFPMRGSLATSLDHVAERCPTGPSCVNPDHLEQVSHRENVSRGRRSVLGNTVSPFVGVVRVADGAWHAQVQINGRPRYIGRGDQGHCAHLADAAFIAAGDKPLNYTLGLVDRPPTDDEVTFVRDRLANQDRKRVAA